MAAGDAPEVPAETSAETGHVAALLQQMKEHQEACENLYSRKLLLHTELTEAKHAIALCILNTTRAALLKQIKEHQEAYGILYDRNLLLHTELTEAKHTISILNTHPEHASGTRTRNQESRLHHIPKSGPML